MKEQSIVITADDRMSDAEIEQAMRDAREYAGQDSFRREALDLVQEAHIVLRKAEQYLKEKGKELDKEAKKQLKNDIHALQKLLAKFKVDKAAEADVEAIRQAKAVLEKYE